MDMICVSMAFSCTGKWNGIDWLVPIEEESMCCSTWVLPDSVVRLHFHPLPSVKPLLHFESIVVMTRRRANLDLDHFHRSLSSSEVSGDGTHIRLKLKLGPPGERHERDAPANGSLPPDPPRHAISRQLPRSTPSPSLSAGAPIIRPIVRSREHVVSESDISVLDLGPSLTESHLQRPVRTPAPASATRFSLLNSAVHASEFHHGFQPRSNEPSAYLPSQQVRTDPDPDVELSTSDSNVSPTNDQPLVPLSIRRRRPPLRLSIPRDSGLRAPPRRRVSRNRVPFTGDIHCLGYGHGFGGYEQVHEWSDFYICEEDSDGEFLPSVSHGPWETPLSVRAAARRARRAFGQWDRRSSDLFTTGLSEYERDLGLFSDGAVDDMVN